MWESESETNPLRRPLSCTLMYSVFDTDNIEGSILFHLFQKISNILLYYCIYLFAYLSPNDLLHNITRVIILMCCVVYRKPFLVSESE